MNFSITNDMIPPEAGISLNTSSFSNLIPELTSAYPDMLMEFQVFPATSPLLVFSSGNITLKPEIYVEAFVVSPDSLPKSVFLLSVKTKVSAKVMLTSGRITGSIHPARCPQYSKL
uniref:Lipopolysaccharide-binding protein n=1 Tax=Phascolarctos cinereus TaxID=38626 RepID=A0A6P5KP88_PHACI|nr:lipopolysaccharide-binding protein-like isoform X1 [Phascolarctos cinereus]